MRFEVEQISYNLLNYNLYVWGSKQLSIVLIYAFNIIFLGLSIWLESEGSMGGYRSHMVCMERGGTTSQVELVLCPNWPHQSVPVSNCVHLVDCVNKKIPQGKVLRLHKFTMFCWKKCIFQCSFHW